MVILGIPSQSWMHVIANRHIGKVIARDQSLVAS